jgi:hypothetical protein
MCQTQTVRTGNDPAAWRTKPSRYLVATDDMMFSTRCAARDGQAAASLIEQAVTASIAPA